MLIGDMGFVELLRVHSVLSCGMPALMYPCGLGRSFDRKIRKMRPGYSRALRESLLSLFIVPEQDNHLRMVSPKHLRHISCDGLDILMPLSSILKENCVSVSNLLRSSA